LTDNTDIAVPAGVDREGRRLFRKGDSLLTEDELQADAEKLYAARSRTSNSTRNSGSSISTYAYTLNVLRAFKVDHSADAPPVLRDRELTLVDRPRDVREQGRHRLTELGTRRVEIALRVGDRG